MISMMKNLMSYRSMFRVACLFILFWGATANANISSKSSKEVEKLLDRLDQGQKIGQLQQIDLSMAMTIDEIPEETKTAIREGRVGSALNIQSREVANEVQRIAKEESEAGIPLLLARDVIHGYKTIFPIPLGQAASWNADIVEQGARVAAREASAVGIRWTFAPMLDISRDPRWGRIAESFGEDPLLTSIFAEASVKGYQGDDLSDPTSIAACAKHFLGYGAAEGGRDYNVTYIPEPLLHNIYLKPFKAAVDAGSATVMSAFNDLNGVPASTNDYLLNGLLREELGFDGVLVSDWNSVIETVVHGHARDNKQAAEFAANANLDMEMVSESYQDHLAALIDEGRVSEQQVDKMVRRIIRLKKELGLFEQPYAKGNPKKSILTKENLKVAKQSAVESLVLLKNNQSVLPLSKKQKIALIGPLADAGHDQMGTWVLDGEKKNSVTVLDALTKSVKRKSHLNYVRGLASSRSKETTFFADAVKAAEQSDVVVFVGGEEAALSGEAHSRADIRLPGAQEALIRELKKVGKPIVLVIMAGRQIALNDIIDDIDAILMAWHPGSMGGEALADVLLGKENPVGRLPVTWPKLTGQVPLYYNHPNTGRPPVKEAFVHMDDYALEVSQHSTGHASFYIDAGFEPQFPFGFGLSYSQVKYSDLKISDNVIGSTGSTIVSATIENIGSRETSETVQLYIQDIAASVTRPVRELKAFQRVTLKPKEKKVVEFSLAAEDLAFYNRQLEYAVEAGEFKLWVAPHAAAGLEGRMAVKESGRFASTEN